MEGSGLHPKQSIPTATAQNVSMFVVPFSRTGPLCRCQLLFVYYTLFNWRTSDLTATKPQPNNGSYDTEIQRSYWQGQTSVSTLAQVSPTPEYSIHISERPLGPANGVGIKIWTCFPNLPAQAWVYTDDNRIALKNQGMSIVQVPS